MTKKEWIKYYRQRPDKFLENLMGIKLKPWQKVYLEIIDRIPPQRGYNRKISFKRVNWFKR